MGIVTGAVAAYLVGCVPVARLVRRIAAGHQWAEVAAGAADFLKGFGAIAFFSPDASALGQALTVTAVVAGDQWPVVGEHGKLGFWTAFGALTALTPITPIVFGVLWGVGFVLTGYLVAGRLAGLALFWLALGFVAGWPLGLAALPACVMVLERSRPDWERLRAGNEVKLGWHSRNE